MNLWNDHMKFNSQMNLWIDPREMELKDHCVFVSGENHSLTHEDVNIHKGSPLL